jgi:hypothetical protein
MCICPFLARRRSEQEKSVKTEGKREVRSEKRGERRYARGERKDERGELGKRGKTQEGKGKRRARGARH